MLNAGQGMGQMKYFIALTFAESYLHFKNLNSFRQRFDSKYSYSPKLQMTILPPFNCDEKNMENVIEVMVDSIEDIFLGLDDIQETFFHTIGCFYKKNVLYLLPRIDENIFHAQEHLFKTLRDEKVTFKRSKNPYDLFMPLGRFNCNDELNFAMDCGHEEISLPFTLVNRSISLFKNDGKKWIPIKELFSFENDIVSIVNNNEYNIETNEIFNT